MGLSFCCCDVVPSRSSDSRGLPPADRDPSSHPVAEWNLAPCGVGPSSLLPAGRQPASLARGPSLRPAMQAKSSQASRPIKGNKTSHYVYNLPSTRGQVFIKCVTSVSAICLVVSETLPLEPLPTASPASCSAVKSHTPSQHGQAGTAVEGQTARSAASLGDPDICVLLSSRLRWTVQPVSASDLEAALSQGGSA